MSIYLPVAAGLLIVAAGAVAMRLLKSHPTLRPAIWTAIACMGIIALGATVLYAALSRDPPKKSSKTDSPESMVEGLARRLRAHPGDLNGWLMLGRSYTVLKEYPRAVRAYQQAVRASGGTNADALLGEAQARMSIDHNAITGAAGDLVERALALEPNDPDTLYLAATVALHRGQLTLARTRFGTLLTLNAPADLAQDARIRIASIDQQLGRGRAAASPSAPQGAVGPSIRVYLRLAPSLAQRASPNAPLYVFVRDAKQPGAPLAVKRLASHFPQALTLTAADSMMPGHTFSAGERVQVVARIAPSGNPMKASGDLDGQANYRIGATAPVRILIDHVTH